MPIDIDLERGLTASTQFDAINDAKTQGQYDHDRGELEIFQVLVGIKTPVEIVSYAGDNRSTKKNGHVKPSTTTGRPDRVTTALTLFEMLHHRQKVGRSIGLYQRAINEAWKNRISFQFANYITVGLYLLQIFLAATFTALSAYENKSSVSLTVLGAINTVVAGVLAWLKGQGLPNRYRKARDAFQAIVKDIDMTERLFAEVSSYPIEQGAKKPNPFFERDRLEKMYEGAKMDQQANYPDLYVSTQDRAHLQAGNENFRNEMAKREAGLQAKIDELEARLAAKE